MNTNTAETLVRIRQIGSQIEEASARGFRDNTRAVNLVSELKDAVELLEDLAFREFHGVAA